MPTSNFSLEGQVAIVTGAASGLGAAGAAALATAGANVVVAGLQPENLASVAADIEKATGRRALAVPTDVTDGKAADALAAATLDMFGRIDILFNSAGVIAGHAAVDYPAEDWARLFEVNVTGTFNAIKAVLPDMTERRRGRIINMASVLAHFGAPNRSGYSATKGAVLQLTRSLAVELGPSGITVNALGPTAIATDLNRELMQSQPQLYAGLLARTPLGRHGTPDDLAGPLVFLASPAAAFVTGQILYVDGGYTVHN
ncbi:MAG TPA: glucose 1-dehydrogenase [Pseudolabrys sp.]|nr:glucose 1-dehydrogenase [Pseudolabrys sp.]